MRIVRLLVSDLQSLLEEVGEGEEGDTESDDSGGEDCGLRGLEALLQSGEEQWAESEEDPDLQDDPLLQLDVQVGSIWNSGHQNYTLI